MPGRPGSGRPGSGRPVSGQGPVSGRPVPGQGPVSGSAAQDGVIDLLGLLAYASLVAFFRLSDDAALATSLADKAALAEMAVAEFGHFRLLRGQIESSQADPWAAMQPFVAAVDAFHART